MQVASSGGTPELTTIHIRREQMIVAAFEHLDLDYGENK